VRRGRAREVKDGNDLCVVKPLPDDFDGLVARHLDELFDPNRQYLSGEVPPYLRDALNGDRRVSVMSDRALVITSRSSRWNGVE
jgi:hypothetical protein